MALFEIVIEAGGDGVRGEWIDAARESIRRALLLGEARFPEADSPSALDNALALLVADEVLVGDGAPRQADSQLRPGARFGALVDRRDRLAEAVGSR